MHATAQQISSAQRIVFFGVTGAGKTTAARRLSAVRGLPFIDGDSQIGFLPATQRAWAVRPVEQQVALAAELLGEQRWVLDTAWGPWRTLAFERADLVVCLDYSRLRTFARLLRRTVGRSITGARVCNGNKETWRRSFFHRESILRWHRQTFTRRRAQMRELANDSCGTPVLVVRSPRQLEQALA